MLKYLTIVLLIFAPLCHAYQYTLSICAIFQDEAPYLKEWIDYHRKVGVEHFWLYNNNSSDNYLEILQFYIDGGVVDLIEWPLESNGGHDFYYRVQCGAYNDCLSKVKNKTKWLAIIDSDEFIVPKIQSNIAEILESRYSWCSGICVNWQCFGTSHIERCPQGETLRHLVWKMKWNDWWNERIKSIVQPLHVTECPSPHYCHYLPNHWHVNTKYQRILMESPVNIDILQINHYWTRDEWYLNNKKIPRYLKWHPEIGNGNPVLETANKMNEEYDDFILRYIL